MIIGKNISKTYIDSPILSNIDFKIGNGIKVGLVGKNGCGKTTLFRVISGIEACDSGSIEYENEKIGYLPQEFNFPNILVGEFLKQKLDLTWEMYKVEKLVSQLEFVNFDIYQEIYTLSEGQKMKLMLLNLLLDNPTTLLIDEPTNHLDIEGILWFENYIKTLQKSVVMISHDRQFLNSTVNEIWEIENSQLLKFVGDYDAYKESKLKLVNKWNEEYVRFLKRKTQLENLLSRSREKNISRSGKGVQSVKKRIEREITSKKKEKYVSSKMNKVTFATDVRSQKLMLSFEDVTKSYGNKLVFENLNFEVRGQDRVWLYGSNGAGKTTLVKIIMAEEKPSSGQVTIGNNIKIGYFAQKQTHLDFKTNVFDYFMSETGCPYEKTFGALKRFLFDETDIKKRVGDLSPGERARFAFAIFSYKDYDLLILDEPTNHLDIETKEVIEESLLEFKGTLILVSHDRFFVERLNMDKMFNLKEMTFY
ncbi:MAG: ABC-F family ATP-binding cassette domain-containing protein [Patescibacteria group bacterium]